MYVNVDKIVSFQYHTDAGCVRLWLDDNESIHVDETLEEVILRIADATDVYLEPEPAGEEVATIRKLEEAT